MESAYIVYHEKIKTSRIFVRECSLVPIYSMVLFGGARVDVELQRGQFVLSMEDGWIKFVTFSQVIAECLKEMRRELDKLLEIGHVVEEDGLQGLVMLGDVPHHPAAPADVLLMGHEVGEPPGDGPPRH